MQTEVALLSIAACGVGLNLTRAKIALFAEMSWSYGKHDRLQWYLFASSMLILLYVDANI